MSFYFDIDLFDGFVFFIFLIDDNVFFIFITSFIYYFSHNRYRLYDWLLNIDYYRQVLALIGVTQLLSVSVSSLTGRGYHGFSVL